MADNVVASAGSGGATFATDDISGVHFPRAKLVWGADGTATDASAAAPLPVVQTGALPAGTNAIGKLTANSGVDIGDVDVTSLPALPAGTNNIGDVDVLTLPALPAGTNNIGDVDVLTIAAGDNNIGNVDVVTLPADPLGANADASVAAGAAGSISAKLRRATQGLEDLKTGVVLAAGTNNIGDVDVLSIAAGDNNIGNVDVVTLPALPAGTNNIGDVDVLTLPAIPAGTNNIGDVDVLSIAAGDNNIGNVDVVTLPALVAGTANIGDVDVLTLPAIPTGTNTIGNVGTVPLTSGGCSVSSFLSTAAVQSTAIKASAGQVYSLQFFSLNAAARYVRLYNQTSAPGTGDTANIVWRGMIPGNTAGAGFVAEFPNGIAFSAGIGIRVTAAVADNDGTALAANEIMGNVSYK